MRSVLPQTSCCSSLPRTLHSVHRTLGRRGACINIPFHWQAWNSHQNYSFIKAPRSETHCLEWISRRGNLKQRKTPGSLQIFILQMFLASQVRILPQFSSPVLVGISGVELVGWAVGYLKVLSSQFSEEYKRQIHSSPFSCSLFVDF